MDGIAKKTKSPYEPEKVGKKDGQVERRGRKTSEVLK